MSPATPSTVDCSGCPLAGRCWEVTGPTGRPGEWNPRRSFGTAHGMIERDYWSVQDRQRVMLLLFIPAIVLAIFSRPFGLEGTWLDIGFEVVAWALFVCGARIRFWATLYMGGRKRKALVTDGPYSLSQSVVPGYRGDRAVCCALRTERSCPARDGALAHVVRRGHGPR